MRKRLASLASAAVIAAACASAQGSGPPVPVTPPPAGSTGVAPPVPAAPATAGPLSTVAGVYSAAQAARGETVFTNVCLSCHVPTDYQGDAFQSKFVGGTAFDMYENIRSSMPQDNPGSLTNEQYTDLVAYLFKLNGLPTRDKDMPAVVDSLKAIRVDAPKAPPATFRHHLGLHHGSTHIR
ncbi:MAG: cytochrome c [Gemmatimonadota bacterium]|nr:cytochrome c [Gemmatimonadota bacterium]